MAWRLAWIAGRATLTTDRSTTVIAATPHIRTRTEFLDNVRAGFLIMLVPACASVSSMRWPASSAALVTAPGRLSGDCVFSVCCS